MTRCETCGEWIYGAWLKPSHVCPPAYRVWDVDEEEREDAQTVYAADPEEAARTWAEDYDPGSDYTIVSGSPATVIVEDASGTRSVWRVTGESEPVYTARQVGQE